MKNQKTASGILQSCYKNCDMGTYAISVAMSRATSPQLKHELENEKSYYTSIRKQTAEQLKSMNIQPQTTGIFPKAMTNIKLNAINENSDIAKLMIKGTTSGIIEISSGLNGCEKISDDIKRQANAMVQHEQNYIKRLNKFV